MVIPTASGGHAIEIALSGHCWLCTACKTRSTSWARLASTKCSGVNAKLVGGTIPLVDGAGDGCRKHSMITSGTVQWCETCGSFTESRTSRRMRDVCLGPPPAAAGNGGMKQQLASLKAGRHPVTGVIRPTPSSSSALGSGTYSQLKVGPSDDRNFSPYVPEEFVKLTPSGMSVVDKRRLLKGRLLYRIGREAAQLRKAKRRATKAEVREIIRAFEHGSDEEEPLPDSRVHTLNDEQEEPVADDVDSDEEFWASLPVVCTREKHINAISTRPDRYFPGKAVTVRSSLVTKG